MFRKLLQISTGTWVALCMTTAAILMCVFLFQFLQDVEKYQIILNDKRLADVARRNVNTVRSLTRTYQDALYATTVLYEKFDDFTSPEALAFLEKVSKNAASGRFLVDYAGGSSYLSSGRILQSNHQGKNENILRGNMFVSDVLVSESGKSVINLFTPLHKDGVPVASLRYEIETEKLTDAFGINIYANNGYFHIIDQNGAYVAATRTENSFLMNDVFFSAIDKLSFEPSYSAAKIKKDFKNGVSGLTKYSYNNETRHAYYEPININGWMMMTIVPKKIVTQQVDDNVNLALVLLVKMMLLILTLSGWVIYTQRRARIRADLNERCYKLLAEQTGKAIYEWDFEGDKITTLSNFENVFGHVPSRRHAENEMLGTKLIHPEDIDTYKNIFFEVHSGRNVNDVKFRLKDTNGNYQWCTFTGIIIRNDKGVPFKALGTLESIDRQVRVEESLRFRANTDSLTGFYNKKTAEILITEALASTASKTINALICVDIDNFKTINDSFGHLYGDRVLQDVAREMKQLFRSTDIVGRFGGDEFVLFLIDIPSVSFVKKKMVELNQSLHKVYIEGGISHTMSVSLGVAIYPDDGMTYEELYKKADDASYEAKRSGKNTFRFSKSDTGGYG